MKTFFIFFFGYIFLFLAIDVLQKKVITRTKWSRKATHISSGIISYFLPLYLSKNEIILIGFSFVLILAITKWKKILSMHEVKRQTWGELFYPLSIMLLPFICLPENPQAFQFGILVLAFSDGLAGALGEGLHYKPVVFKKHTKSLGGSLSFFASTLIILLLMVGFNDLSWPTIFAVSMGLTVLEFVLIYGLDNLLIPIAAGWIFQLLFS